MRPQTQSQREPSAALSCKPTPDGKPGIGIAIPSFGYKSSISICRVFGFIRKAKTTDGARVDGRMLHSLWATQRGADQPSCQSLKPSSALICSCSTPSAMRSM